MTRTTERHWHSWRGVIWDDPDPQMDMFWERKRVLGFCTVYTSPKSVNAVLSSQRRAIRHAERRNENIKKLAEENAA